MSKISKKLLGNKKITLAYYLNELGMRLIVLSRRIILKSFPYAVDKHILENPDKLLTLHRKIDSEIRQQKKYYPHYKYFNGHPYQQLNILNTFGDRNTEERFENYGLVDLINKHDTVLDIGCNCGFMAIYTAFRTGCKVYGVDVNEFMINVGKHVADYLNISSLVHLKAVRFQEYNPGRKFSVIFSFASHWTDDKNHRPDFHEYMMRLYNLLDKDGLLIFESHTADVGNEEFYSKMQDQKKLFLWDGSKLLDNKTRELYIMRKNSSKDS